MGPISSIILKKFRPTAPSTGDPRHPRHPGRRAAPVRDPLFVSLRNTGVMDPGSRTYVLGGDDGEAPTPLSLSPCLAGEVVCLLVQASQPFSGRERYFRPFFSHTLEVSYVSGCVALYIGATMQTRQLPRLISTSSERSQKILLLLLAALFGALVFYLLMIVFPRMSLMWGYSGIKRVFYEDLGWSDALSSIVALIGSFLNAILWLPLVLGTIRIATRKFDPVRTVPFFLIWFAVYGYAPLLHAMYGTEQCANQRTGKPIKWYVADTGGKITLYDSPGFDSAGSPKRPATAQICRIIQAQKAGLRPQQIKDDPRYIKFFDELTAQPRVWYSKISDSQIDLFDAEGVHPATGEPLWPITKAVAQEAQAGALERAARAERAARLAAEQDDIAKKESARRQLVGIFDVDSYENGTVIIAIKPRKNDEISSQTAKLVQQAFSSRLRRKDIRVDEFRPAVYSAGHIDALVNGNSQSLSATGLLPKLRAALVGTLDTQCRSASEVAGIVSCTVSVQLRIVLPDGKSSLSELSVTGAGGSAAQAAVRAAELLSERHPEILDEV
jgi:hypothetical protein